MTLLQIELDAENISISLGVSVLDDFDNNVDYDMSTIISEITTSIQNTYTIDTIKDDPIISAYRSFYWKKLGLDPTKKRPSGEALNRRILGGGKLPVVNFFVDACNWASAKTRVGIGAYDYDSVKFPLILKKAAKGDKVTFIGGDQYILKGSELIIQDSNGYILSYYPHRDADISKITLNTKKIIIIPFAVEGINKKSIENCVNELINILKKTRKTNQNFMVSDFSFYTS